MPELSIIIPAHNEQDRIEPTVREYVQWCKAQKIAWEMILVNSASQDKTDNIIKRLAKEFLEIKCITLEIAGKGLAVKTGVLRAGGKYILFTDADCATLPNEVSKLILHIKQDNDLVIGTRNSSGLDVKRSFIRKTLAKIMNSFTNIYLKTELSDHYCGFKLFTAESAKKIFSIQKIDGYSFDPEILFVANKLGYKIAEVPIKWEEKPGSKLRIFSIFEILFDLLRIKKLHGTL